MTLIEQALSLGIVEGLTEFLPVSSTGHLILFGKLLGFEGETASTFEVFIQLGAILAVVVLYFKRFAGLLTSGSDGFSGKVGIVKLALGCAPAFVLGFLLHHQIKSWFGSATSVCWAFLIGGVVMLLVEARKTVPKTLSLEEISYSQSLGIGFFQCFALWPGMSRAGSTIVGGLLLGVERKVAAEFSFLLAVPVMFAATGYEMFKSRALLSASDTPVFAVGFFVSFVTAIIGIKFFIGLLKTFTLRPFAIYRILVALVVLGTGIIA